MTITEHLKGLPNYLVHILYYLRIMMIHTNGGQKGNEKYSFITRRHKHVYQVKIIRYGVIKKKKYLKRALWSCKFPITIDLCAYIQNI